MTKDEKTLLYVGGGGLLVALIYFMSKKTTTTSGSGDKKLTTDKTVTPYVPKNTYAPAQPSQPYVPAQPSQPYVPVVPVNYVPPTTTNPVLRVKILTARDPLTLRRSPSTNAASVGSLARNSFVDVYSYATGDSVSGNTNWFNNGSGYFSAYYTDHPSVGANLGGIDTAPPATGGPSGNATVTTTQGNLNVRSAPNTSSSIVGSLPNRTTITVDGTVTGQSVGGNTKWYSISSPKIGYAFSGNIIYAPGSGEYI